MTDTNYETLVRILDKFCREAPASAAIYYPRPGNRDGVIQARSRAYLHLYLKVKFGLLDFSERESFVTDGPFDGGVDAYYIEHDARIIHCLQSKFRATGENFRAKTISADDLLKVELKRILDGNANDEKGNRFNPAIRRFQRELRNIPDIGRYSYKVVLLGNPGHLQEHQLKRLCEGFPIEQLDFNRIFTELVFPVVNGIYFNRAELTINIDLTNTRDGKDQLNYNVNMSHHNANVMLLFVPTKEIGRILYKYRNSILTFNPRSYLGLQNNEVNQDIRESIINKGGNEFALFNNGITLLSSSTSINNRIGKKGAAQLVVTNPQIINGGQTAFTLSRVFEDQLAGRVPSAAFQGKEVLLKVITIDSSSKPKAKSTGARAELISDVSKASNSQTRVDEADRRSNEPIQLELQRQFFTDCGLFYERKRGEFADGLRDGYITDDAIIGREQLMRIALAIDATPSLAKSSVRKHFTPDGFRSAPLRPGEVKRYQTGYQVLRELNIIRTNALVEGKNLKRKYGAGFGYAQYAIVAVVLIRLWHPGLNAKEAVLRTVGQWKKFESWLKKRRANARYFSTDGGGFINYYRGATVNQDIRKYRFTH